jgi:DNA recombination protein RmuC
MSASVLGSDGLAITLGVVLVLLVAVVVALGVVILRGARTAAIETRMAELAGAQTESSIRLQAFHEMLAGNQADLARAVNERLDAVSQHLSQYVKRLL